MLARRSLSLGVAVISEPVLRREDLVDALRAQNILEHAQQQAEVIRTQALVEGQQLIDQAVGEFWSVANEFLLELHEEREAFRREALVSVEELLNLSLSRLLDEAQLPERIRALLGNLADSQPVAVAATLSCHPDLAEIVGEWLSHSRFTKLWRLESNNALPVGSLRLTHTNGSFDVDWESLRNGLLL